MAEINSELINKKRLFPQSAFSSIRSTPGNYRTVVLDSEGFKYEGNANSNIVMHINKGEYIKVAHHNNGGLSHVGVPSYEGKNFVLAKYGTPSVGSKNFGFSEYSLFIDGRESPDIIVGKDSELIFACLDHDIILACSDIDGREILLSDTESPEFASSARCFSLFAHGFNIGDVIKYYIKGHNNSGGSILIVASSDARSDPWWKLHKAIHGQDDWKIGINPNLHFSSEIKSKTNNRVNSISGNVISVNGIQQPRLLAACGDYCEISGFEKDTLLGEVIISQDANKFLSIDSSSSHIYFNCSSRVFDPYDPYDMDYFGFDSNLMRYYGSRDKNSGEQILVKDGGWNIGDLVHVKSNRSGFVETIHFPNPGDYVVCCEDFANSWMYFHVHVKNYSTDTNEKTGDINPSSIIRLGEEGINVYFRNDIQKDNIKNFIYLNIDASSFSVDADKQVEYSVYSSLSSQLSQYRVKYNSALCVKFDNFSPRVDHVYSIWNSLKRICEEKKCIGLIDYDGLRYNQLRYFKKLGQLFYIDFSHRLISSYEKDVFSYIWAVIDPSVSGYEEKLKELITLGVKNIISDYKEYESSQMASKLSNFLAPEFKDNLKFYCSRGARISEPSRFMGFSKHVNGRYSIEQIMNTQYGPLDLFYRLRDSAREGYSNLFLTPNGTWKFPNAGYMHWQQIDKYKSNYRDMFYKIKTDFDLDCGLSIGVISARESAEDFSKFCLDIDIKKICILDASYISDIELNEMQKRFIENNIEIYLEGMPSKASSGVLSHSYCYGKWLWSSEHRGSIPAYLNNLVREA